MTWIAIKARDVWLFRDGKPFNGGQDHIAQSFFPPTPFTLQGIIRHKISDSLGVTLHEYKKGGSKSERYIGEHGSLTKLGSFSLGGYTLGWQTGESVKPLFPSPADLLFDEIFNDSFISTPTVELVSDAPLPRVPQIKEDYENKMGHWLTEEDFSNYLNGQLNGIQPIGSDVLYSVDSRFGVSTNSLTSYREEGQLYQINYIHPKSNTRLLASVSDDIPTDHLTGSMIMGGEQRQGEAYLMNNIPPHFSHGNRVTGNFKVIFLTPAYFDGGWKPQSDWSTLFGGHAVTLVGAALYRPSKIGGWDNHLRKPRTMNHYVTPGSVYYFNTHEEIPLPPYITHNPNGVDAGKLGFGQYAATTWSSEKDK